MRVNSRFSVVVIGAAALALGLSACGGDPEATGAVTLNGTEPQSPLVPSNTQETGGGNVIDNIFTGLVEYNADTAAPELAMADSIEPNDDKTVWTVKIKEDWTFHDGTPVKAESFVDAWNYGAYGPNAQLNSYWYGPDGLGIKGSAEVAGDDKNGDETITPDEAPIKEMSGLKVIDDTTFEVTLESPNGLFETVVGYSAFAPMAEAFFADPEAAGQAPIGNGPFKFVQWDKKQQIVLTAFDEYKGDDKPKVKDATFKIYQDTDAAYADLLAGQLDVLDSIPASALAGDQFKTDLGERWVVQPALLNTVLSYPLWRTEYQSLDLRRALSQGIDRGEITEKIFSNTRAPADGLVSPVVDGYQEDACGEWCTLDVEAAKANLAKSGFTGPLVISYNADGPHKEWTEAVCNQLKNNLGLACTATPFVDFSTYRSLVDSCTTAVRDKATVPADCSSLGLIRSGWQADYPHIENFLAPLYSSSGAANDSTYANPEVDALLKSGKGKSGDEANADYQAAEKLIIEDLPVIPLWFTSTTGGWSEAVSAVKFTPFSRVDLTSIEKG